MLKIVLTGGPCGGKSTILSHLSQELESRGYKVITVPESATELIINGICPSENISMDEFQTFVTYNQLAKEDMFAESAKYYDSDKLVMFCDRGVFDGCAYADKDRVIKKILESKNLTITDAYNRYDAVLHLVTAADGAEQFYQWNDPTKDSVGNNAARYESPEEARIKDKKTLDAWIGHPHLRVFDNSTDFDGKIKRVVEEVFSLLGEPIPSEIERKYLIKKPTDKELNSLGCISVTNIIQTYLKSKDGVERRVRQRGTKESGYSFYYTEKKNISEGIRSEKEEKISANEYISLMAEADTSMHQISKTRHCFVYDKKYFELDIYPFSDEYAILEIELNNINEQFTLPPLGVIKEVTNDESFRNYHLAKTLSFENADRGIEEKTAISEEWIYETGREEPEILGSGSHYYCVLKTRDKTEAFEALKECARNYLIRWKKVDGKKVSQWWDSWTKKWINSTSNY